MNLNNTLKAALARGDKIELIGQRNGDGLLFSWMLRYTVDEVTTVRSGKTPVEAVEKTLMEASGDPGRSGWTD